MREAHKRSRNPKVRKTYRVKNWYQTSITLAGPVASLTDVTKRGVQMLVNFAFVSGLRGGNGRL